MSYSLPWTICAWHENHNRICSSVAERSKVTIFGNYIYHTLRYSKSDSKKLSVSLKEIICAVYFLWCALCNPEKSSFLSLVKGQVLERCPRHCSADRRGRTINPNCWSHGSVAERKVDEKSREKKPARSFSGGYGRYGKEWPRGGGKQEDRQENREASSLLKQTDARIGSVVHSPLYA